mmetsp:Transcript_41123/g.74150  ORF Transcript_41123/g.74150 Transcript_41123/m.74150 type:complete len:223 (+) Transcript_41123:220-888(+)
MISSKEEALSSGPRDRSYSDNTNPTAITMGTDTISITNNVPNIKMAIITNKKSLHPHHRHHGNHRPRSKSCDRHYHHSPSVHKKNRLSPKSSSSSSSSQQQLRGKMWIRPVAVRRSTMPFRPVLASVAPSPTASSAEQEVEDRGGLFDNNNVTPVAPKSDSPFRQVTSSPISPKSSFDSFQRHHGGMTSSPKSARIIFGESGKPIKPRNALSLLQLRWPQDE